MIKIVLYFGLTFLGFTAELLAADSKNSLNENDRQSVKEVLDYLDKAPAVLKKEILEYRKNYNSLLQESQALYTLLSPEAKKFLKDERDRKAALSPNAKNELQKYHLDNKATIKPKKTPKDAKNTTDK